MAESTLILLVRNTGYQLKTYYYARIMPLSNIQFAANKTLLCTPSNYPLHTSNKNHPDHIKNHRHRIRFVKSLLYFISRIKNERFVYFLLPWYWSTRIFGWFWRAMSLSFRVVQRANRLACPCIDLLCNVSNWRNTLWTRVQIMAIERALQASKQQAWWNPQFVISSAANLCDEVGQWH